jgi:hypothetical protein
MTKKRITRVAIVCDADGTWFVRRVAFSKYDRERGEMIYRCDRPMKQRGRR